MKFDHYSITVSNLDKSAAFYRDVLSLPEIENKTQKEYIRWFGLDEHELHLIEGNTDEISTIRNVHFALTTSDFERLLSKLKNHGITYYNSRGEPGTFKTRPDGIRQVYFRDPDGYWLEVNDVEAHKTK